MGLGHMILVKRLCELGLQQVWNVQDEPAKRVLILMFLIGIERGVAFVKSNIQAATQYCAQLIITIVN